MTSDEHTPALRATPLERGSNASRTHPGSPLERGARRAGCVRATTLRVVATLCGPTIAFAQAPPAPKQAPAADPLYEQARQLFEQLAPAEIKEQFEFPSPQQWDAFAQRLQDALAGDSLEALAANGPEARAALGALRTFPGYEDVADWLEQRLDEIEGAQQAIAPAQPPTPKPAPGPTPPKQWPPTSPAPRPPKTGVAAPSTLLPHYELWLGRVRARPVPARAAALLPTLRAAFAREGVPPELVWLAEAESSFNPNARSPVGAKGLFQFMPDTARSLGLGTFLPDQRTDPEKSARAAARYLKTLHGKFGSWPLALAAYNAGEGRVSRTLAARKAKDFSAIATALPAETRMYVPKVCALVAVRAGVPPERIGK